MECNRIVFIVFGKCMMGMFFSDFLVNIFDSLRMWVNKLCFNFNIM